MRHLAKLVNKDAKHRFHNKPQGRFELSPIEEEIRNTWEVREIMTEEQSRAVIDNNRWYYEAFYPEAL